jgi:hydrogenase nickel incorporation protein HypA/HybF
MHELSITHSILDIVKRHAEKAGAKRVTTITLVIGELTGFVDDSIQFYFDFLSKDTLSEGAQLVFERVEAKVQCHACGAVYAPPQTRVWVCPECEALGGEIVSGKEFSVASIEIE